MSAVSAKSFIRLFAAVLSAMIVCGNSIGSSTKKSDSECTMVCSGNPTEFCGGRDRLTLYSTGDAEEPPTEEPTPACISTNIARFNPLAVFKAPPPSGPLSRSIGMINVNTVPHVSYGLLSSAGTGGWLYYALQSGAIYPKSAVPFPAPVSFSVVPGYSPIFVSTQIPPPAYSGFCSMVSSFTLVLVLQIYADVDIDMYYVG